MRPLEHPDFRAVDGWDAVPGLSDPALVSGVKVLPLAPRNVFADISAESPDLAKPQLPPPSLFMVAVK